MRAAPVSPFTLLVPALLPAGWFTIAPFLGAFTLEAMSSPKAAATAAAKCWAVATSIGLAIRGASKGYVPPTPFIIVSFVATFVVLVGWRTAFAAVTKQVSVCTSVSATLFAKYQGLKLSNSL